VWVGDNAQAFLSVVLMIGFLFSLRWMIPCSKFPTEARSIVDNDLEFRRTGAEGRRFHIKATIFVVVILDLLRCSHFSTLNISRDSLRHRSSRPSLDCVLLDVLFHNG
jgi:hypothetical protein